MTADEDALLATIAANPADDLPRLVYADWLEEHGRGVRAEFIRLQIEIAKLEVGPRDVIDRNVPLWKRQQELLDGHLGELLGSPTAGPTLFEPDGGGEFKGLVETVGRSQMVSFSRGFLKLIDLTAAEFNAHAGELTRLRPPPGVRVATGNYRRFVEDALGPGRGLVVSLFLPDTATGDEPPFNWLQHDIRVIWRGFDQLREVDLAANYVGEAGLALIPWADLPALVDLDVSNNNITDAGVIALINTGLPQRLERLILGGNPIGDQAAYELADRVGRSRTLKHLNLRYTDMTNAGQQAILSKFGGRVDLF